MEIILQSDFPSLGYTGDKVNVRSGYARNYLIPRGIALEVSSFNASVLKHRVAAITAKKAKLKAEAEKVGQEVAKVALEFTLKTGSQGKSFGSITVRDLDAVFKEKGFTFDKKQIKIIDHIKGPGEYRAEVKLHSDVVIPLTIKVIAAAQPVAATRELEEGEDAPKKRRSRKKADADEAAAESAEETPAE
jgi:large subunit ribosomal protein L9